MTNLSPTISRTSITAEVFEAIWSWKRRGKLFTRIRKIRLRLWLVLGRSKKSPVIIFPGQLRKNLWLLLIYTGLIWDTLNLIKKGYLFWVICRYWDCRESAPFKIESVKDNYVKSDHSRRKDRFFLLNNCLEQA